MTYLEEFLFPSLKSLLNAAFFASICKMAKAHAEPEIRVKTKGNTNLLTVIIPKKRGSKRSSYAGQFLSPENEDRLAKNLSPVSANRIKNSPEKRKSVPRQPLYPLEFY